MGSKEPCVEADPLDAGWSMVATAMSSVFDLFDLDRSFALEKRIGTSVLTAEVMDSGEAIKMAKEVWSNN